MIDVQDGVPIPRSRSDRLRKYPWAELAVGQSFFVAGEKQTSLIAAAWGWAKRQSPGARFTSRKVVENGVAGVRVWRTA